MYVPLNLQVSKCEKDSTFPQGHRVPKPVTDDLYSSGIMQCLHRSYLVKNEFEKPGRGGGGQGAEHMGNE